MSASPIRRRGFTLVELLVVIGIIALLISILLPSLQRARSAANLVACQSNFKQIYNALLFYAGENKGFLPYQSRQDTWNYGDGTNAFIEMTLARYLGYNDIDIVTGEIPEVFRCTESIRAESGAGVWRPSAYRTIAWHPRAFPAYDQQSNPTEWPQRRLSSIRSGATKIAYWDGSQLLDWNMTPEPNRINMDGWRWSWGHMYADPPVFSYDLPNMDLPLDTGPNKDGPGWWSNGSVRFRHLKNTTTPVAFFDGHVESRKIGEIKRKEICISKQQ